MVISLEQRTPHARWRSPLTRPSQAKLTLCRLPTAKEILVITCSFLNIIEHRPFHQSKCVTFRFTAPLSVTDRSAEGLRWTIFVSSRLMGPKNRALRWPAGLSARFRDRSTHPSPHTPPLTKPWPDCFIFRRSLFHWVCTVLHNGITLLLLPNPDRAGHHTEVEGDRVQGRGGQT